MTDQLYRLGNADGPIVRILDQHATTRGVACRCQTAEPGVWAWQRWGVGTIPMPHPLEGDLVVITPKTDDAA